MLLAVSLAALLAVLLAVYQLVASGGVLAAEVLAGGSLRRGRLFELTWVSGADTLATSAEESLHAVKVGPVL